MEPSPGLAEAIEDLRSLFSFVGTVLLVVAVIFVANFVYLFAALAYFRIKTGRWMSPQAEAFMGVPPEYRAGAFEATVQAKAEPKVKQPTAKPKRVKNKPLPAQEPLRPEYGPRVQLLDWDWSPVRGRVHLDQCASSYERKRFFAAYGFDVTMTHEVGLLHASDRKQLNFAIRNRAVIVTYDHDFLDFHNAGERHSGIIHSPQDPRYDQEILRILLRMWGEVTEE